MGTRRALEGHLKSRALNALRHSGTHELEQTLGHLGTWALSKALYLADSLVIHLALVGSELLLEMRQYYLETKGLESLAFTLKSVIKWFS